MFGPPARHESAEMSFPAHPPNVGKISCRRFDPYTAYQPLQALSLAFGWGFLLSGSPSDFGIAGGALPQVLPHVDDFTWLWAGRCGARIPTGGLAVEDSSAHGCLVAPTKHRYVGVVHSRMPRSLSRRRSHTSGEHRQIPAAVHQHGRWPYE